MPIVGILIGVLDFTGLKIQVGTAAITYGNFIQNVVDFLIVAACIFTMLKLLSHFKKTTNDQLDQEEPKKDDTVVLLEEICNQQEYAGFFVEYSCFFSANIKH